MSVTNKIIRQIIIATQRTIDHPVRPHYSALKTPPPPQSRATRLQTAEGSVD